MTTTPGGHPPHAHRQDAGQRRLRKLLRIRLTRAHLATTLMCTLLGFALVVQVQHTQDDQYAGLRQGDLVRILDETTSRSRELRQEIATLEATRRELVSGTDQRQAALEAATRRATTQGILAGQLPAEGPGVEVTLTASEGALPAITMFNMLEELRNAGAEVIQLNEVRVTASSHFTDGVDGVLLDGVVLLPPYRWVAIGDPQAMGPALEIRGGAMAQVRAAGGDGTVRQDDRVEVTAIASLAQPRWAEPIDEEQD